MRGPDAAAGRSSAVIGRGVRKVRGEDHVRSSVSRMRRRALVICASTVLTEICIWSAIAALESPSSRLLRNTSRQRSGQLRDGFGDQHHHFVGFELQCLRVGEERLRPLDGNAGRPFVTKPVERAVAHGAEQIGPDGSQDVEFCGTACQMCVKVSNTISSAEVRSRSQ